MTIRFETLTSTIDAAPGETVDGKIRLSNESGDDATVAVRVIGVGPGSADATSGGQVVHLPAGETLDVEVPIAVPDLLGIGQHAAAFEVRTGLQGSQPLLGSFILSVPSVERILIETVPSTIRGKRRTKFILDLTNNEAQPVTFVVDGAANNVRVRFEEDHFQLAPGEHASTRAKVRGPRRVFGQPTQHNLLLSARGVASSTAITAPYVQRPLIASRIRSIVAAITVVALWAGGMVGLYQWDRSQQADTASQSSLTVDADGAALGSATTSESGTDGAEPADNNTSNADSTDAGSGSDNTTGDDPTSESGDPAAGSSPISTSVTGTIKLDANDGESAADALAGVVIKLRELQLGEAPPAQSVPVGFAARRSASEPSKIWSARRSASPNELGRVRQTIPVTREELPNGIGIWLFGEVQLQRTYELAFQKEGFQSQSFVIEPSDDGALVEVDVNLAPGEGSIDGTLIGPPAGQRNAAITITDGTIEYSTTTDSDTGNWRIEGLSTPTVYTLTATLPGYGTVVQQVALDTGEKDKPAEVVLQPGVATVRGQVFGPEGGVGGAVITITGRGEPRTTTTLTEGNIGAFALSGFDIDDESPQVATITVEQDGFSRASTSRVLNRSDVSGVNFLLTGDRLRLSGIVRGSDSKGLAGASLVLATGDLTFSTQTSSGSDPGEFDVADLPPGDYVITISRYEYIESYEFVTLVEGTPPKDLDVALQKMDPADISNQLQGDLTVSVIDAGGATQGTREVKNPTVKLVETASGAPVDLIPSGSSNEVRYTVPIGTYTVIVTHKDYNPAPRREVTVGLSGETIEVELQKKLKSSARVVDSVSGLALLGYELSVFQQPDVAGQSEREIKVTINQVDGSWETEEALPVGSYRVEARLDGYRIRTDQVLDNTLIAGDRAFRFEIRESLSEKLVLNDIRADPYAEVSGRVFKPTVDPLGTVGFDPIDEPLLEVTMECAGRSPGTPTKTATATVSAELDNVGSDQYDTFTFPRDTFPVQQLDNANCTIDAKAGSAYTKLTAISFSNLSVSNGSAYTDRVVNFALAKPLVNKFKGTAFWIDPRNGQSIPVGGVTLTSLGAGAIVDFKANIAGPEQTELVPEPKFALLTTQGDATSGAWQFNEKSDEGKNQIIGQTLYRVEAPSGGFANGTIKVTVDGNGARTVEAESGAEVTGSDAAGFNIRLFPPLPGTLSGTVEILSTDKNFEKVTVDGYAPTNDPALVAAATPDQTLTANPGAFEFLSADAGTWTVKFGAPPNHEFLVAGGDKVDVLVPPKETNTPFTTQLVELGEIPLTFNSASPEAVLVRPIVSVTAATGAAPIAATTIVGATPGPYKVQGIPVTVNDTGVTPYPVTNYDVTFEAPGFDHETAVVDFTATGTQVNNHVVQFAIQAGSKIPVTVTMEPYGFIRGVIEGNRASGLAALELTQAGGDAELDIKFSKTGVAGSFAPSTIVPTKPTGSLPGTFELTGPPGYYRLTVSHHEFETTPNFIPVYPVVDPRVVLPVDKRATSGDFGMVNMKLRDTSDTPWELQELRTDLELQVFTDLTKATRLNAKYTLTPTGAGPPVEPATCLSVDQPCVISGLGALQEYTLLIESATGATDSFPALTTIVAPQNSSKLGQRRFVGVTAFLPPLGEKFTVEVVGENTNGDPVAAPASTDVDLNVTSVVLEAAYDIEVTDNTDNTGVARKPSDYVGAFPSTPPLTNGTVNSYEFSAVPTGVHTVTATSQPPGYSALGMNSADVIVPQVVGTKFSYVAENVTLTAVLADASGGGDYPDIEWSVSTLGTTTLRTYESGSWTAPTLGRSWSFDEATNRLTITGVPPELVGGTGAFTLTINDDLHTTTVSSPFDIPVLGDGVGTTNIGTVFTLGNAARLSGAVTRSNGTSALPLQGTVVLKDSTGTPVPAVIPPSEAYAGNGAYQRTVALTSTKTFSLLVSADDTDYASIETLVSLQPGSVTTLNVNLTTVATVTVELADYITADTGVPDVPVLPTDPDLDLVVRLITESGQHILPTTAQGLTFEVAGDGPGYRVEVTGTHYPIPVAVPATGFFFPASGQSITQTVALPRVVIVDVTGPTSATLTNSFGTIETSPGRFELSSNLGAGTLWIKAAGYRTRAFAIPDALVTTVSETIYKTVTISGELVDSDDLDVLWPKPFIATSVANGGDPAVTLNGSTTVDGSYTLGGLDVYPDGTDRVWEVKFPSPGSTSQVLHTVTGTSLDISLNIELN
jgi:hypothetical protein